MLKNHYFLVGLIITLALFWPLFVAPYFSHQDDVQTIRLYEMDQCIKDRQIPCRWVPDLGGGYGYPLFNYYGPLPYYLGDFFYFLSGSLLISAKIMFALPLVGSYIFMYLLSRRLWGDMGGTLSALFYSYVPYHALDMYVRGAMGELWAFMFFPATGWALFKVFKQPNLAHSLLLGLFLAFLFLTHNLSAMLFFPLLVLATTLLFITDRNLKFLLSVSFGVIVAIILSAFYLLPMLFEKDLVHLDTTIEGYFSYTEHFKGLRKLFLDRGWNYGDSHREIPSGPKDGLSYQIGWVHLLGWVIALVNAKLLWRSQRFLSGVIIFSSFAIMLSVFMIHPRSEFVWKLIDPLKYLQFPWRFLILIAFFISLIAGSILANPKLKKINRLVWLSLAVLVVGFNFFYFMPQSFYNYSDSDLLTGSKFEHYKMYAIFDYLPKSAEAPPATAATSPYQLITGDSVVKNFAKGTDWMKFETITKSHTILRLSQYYFPNWQIKVDSQEIQIDHKNNLGLMTLLLGQGNHTVETRLHDTPIRLLGNWLSSVGLILFIVLCLLSIRVTKVRLLYYLKAFRG